MDANGRLATIAEPASAFARPPRLEYSDYAVEILSLLGQGREITSEFVNSNGGRGNAEYGLGLLGLTERRDEAGRPAGYRRPWSYLVITERGRTLLGRDGWEDRLRQLIIARNGAATSRRNPCSTKRIEYFAALGRLETETFGSLYAARPSKAPPRPAVKAPVRPAPATLPFEAAEGPSGDLAALAAVLRAAKEAGASSATVSGVTVSF